MKKFLSFLIISGLFLNTSVYAETLYLKNGREIKCQSFWIEKDEYVCQFAGASVYFNVSKVDLKKMNVVASKKDEKNLLTKKKIEELRRNYQSITAIKSNFDNLQFTVGEWSVNNQGIKSNVLITYTKGSYEFTQTYNDGSQNISYMSEYQHNKHPYGKKIKESSGPYGEYYIIGEKGLLFCFDNQGIVTGYHGYCNDWEKYQKISAHFLKLKQLDQKLNKELNLIENEYKRLNEMAHIKKNDVNFSQWENKIDNLIERMSDYENEKLKFEKAL